MTNKEVHPYTFAGIPVKDIKDDTKLQIVKCVCKYHGIERYDIFKVTRKHAIVIPRQVAMYLMCKSKIGYSEIGRYFEMDHATVIYAEKRIQDIIDTEPDFKQQVEDIKQMLRYTKK